MSRQGWPANSEEI